MVVEENQTASLQMEVKVYRWIYGYPCIVYVHRLQIAEAATLTKQNENDEILSSPRAHGC